MSVSNNAMLTQCPHCDTVFQVSDEQLSVAKGRVRCGRCQGVFDALAHPFDQDGGNNDAPSREPHASARTWESDEPDDTPHIIASRDDDPWNPPPKPSLQVDAQETVDAAVADAGPDAGFAADPEESESTETVAEAETGANLAETLPRIDMADMLREQLEEQAASTPAASHGFAWALLALLLMLTLGGQYLFFARADLAKDESLRPWLQRACTYLGCELPLRHEPEQIELLSRDVISHPRIRDALLINATFVNRASFVQVYPVLQITLSNESGTVVAMRRFQPEEYLSQGVHIAAGMTPGAPVRVVLEVVEPKQGATSFQFEFL